MSARDSTETICRRFRDQLEAGKRPKIAEYLGLASASQLPELTAALQSVKAAHALRDARRNCGDFVDGEIERHDSGHSGSTELSLSDSSTDDISLGLNFRAAKPEVVQPGDSIGRYKLIRLLGSGGMGAVWLAEQFQPVNRHVALKLINIDTNPEHAIARFEAERQAIAIMQHPNIAKIFDAGTTESGSPYFVMELVQGIPLNKYCDQKKLGIRERLELMLPVLAAVQHAHQKAIIHRDLKHSNVLVCPTDNPTPKVIDFGLAKAIGHQQSLTDKTMFTEVGCVVGTLQYMSPEQAENKLDIDTRADIYALGVMIYKLLTGTTPLDDSAESEASIVNMLASIQGVDPPRPSARLLDRSDIETIAQCRNTTPEKLVAEVSGDLDWIVMKALDKDRRSRYETANGLAMEIQRYLNDEAVLARPPSRMYALKKFVKRNRGLVASLATIMSLLVAGIFATSWATVWAFSESERANRKSAEAIEAAEAANQAMRVAQKSESEIATLQEVLEVELHAYRTKQAWSDWQLNNVQSAIEKVEFGGDSWETRFLRTQFASSNKTLYGHSGFVGTIDVSANGDYYASASTHDTLKIWNASSGSVMFTRHLADEATCIRFSPDSKWIACADRGNTISVWSIDTGELSKTFGPYEKDINCFSFHPDGSQLVLGLAAQDSVRVAPEEREKKGELTSADLKIVSFQDGSLVQTLSGHTNDVTTVAYSSSADWIVSGSADKTIRFWEMEDAEFVEKRQIPMPYAITSVALSPSEEFLVAGTQGDMVCLWNLKMKELVRTMAHDGPVTDVTFTANGDRIASSSRDRTARIWDLEGKELLSCKGHFSTVTQVAFSPDDSMLITSSDDLTVRVWDSQRQLSTVTTRLHQDVIWDIDISSDHESVVAASQDGTISVTDLNSGIQICKTGKIEQCEFLTVSISPIAPVFVSGDSGGKLRIWDLKTGELKKEVAASEKSIWHVDFSPSGKQLVCAGEDGSLTIWDTSSWKVIEALGENMECISTARFSSDGRFIVSAADDEIVRMFDAHTFEQVGKFVGHRHDVWRAVFSPDSRYIASSGYDGELIIWDVESRKLVHRIKAHDVEIAGLIFADDGSRLMTGSDDGTMKIWDVESAIELLELRTPDHSQCVSIAITDDGSRLVSGSGNGELTIRLAKNISFDKSVLLPHQCHELTVDGLANLLKQDQTKIQIKVELARAKKCCDFFPYFMTWTNVGIAHFRLEQYEQAELALREADRQRKLQYGYDDLEPFIEGYLAMTLIRQGRHEEAEEFKTIFLGSVQPWEGAAWARALKAEFNQLSIDDDVILE